MITITVLTVAVIVMAAIHPSFALTLGAMTVIALISLTRIGGQQ